ncbi:MAG: putative membrane protein, partial [Bacteroidia bacterium]
MILELKKAKRLNETVLLFAFSTLCLVLSVIRVFASATPTFLFLNWNLFLAFIPWALSSLLIIYPKLQEKKLAVITLLGTWLLFFPNAPYILTDLFHLKHVVSMPMWFDLLLILSFAWVGLLFGFMSLWDIEKILNRYLIKSRLKGLLRYRFSIPLFSSLLLFIGSFGIYLGRYLRWNSWDIIAEPFALIYDIGDRFINPFEHPRTWGVTLLMGLFLNLVYWSLR